LLIWSLHVNVRIVDSCKVYSFKSGIFPPFMLDIYFYIVDGIMIDAGSSNIVNKAKKVLENETISAVAITHIHEDHCGLASWMQNNKKVPIYIHEQSVNEALRDSDIPLYRRLVWGNRMAFKALPIPEVIKTKHLTFDVYDAPGHHPYHVVLHENNKGWLFTGDLFVSARQKVAFKDENINDTIKTLTRLLSLNINTIFCSHTGVHTNGKEKLKQKLEYFVNIQKQVRELRQEGYSNEDIDKKLFPKKNAWSIVSQGEWSSLNIIRTVD